MSNLGAVVPVKEWRLVTKRDWLRIGDKVQALWPKEQPDGSFLSVWRPGVLRGISGGELHIEIVDDDGTSHGHIPVPWPLAVTTSRKNGAVRVWWDSVERAAQAEAERAAKEAERKNTQRPSARKPSEEKSPW